MSKGMNNIILKIVKKAIILTTLIFVSSRISLASELMKDFDSLGGNSDLYKKAKALNPELKTQVVQNRIVDRRFRLEVSPTYINYWGGNPYIKSQSTGVELSFHLTPRWSIDVSYMFGFQNDVTSEWSSLVGLDVVPDLDAPQSTLMGFVTYYPIYGKLNIFDQVVHFDIYTSLGAGTAELTFGNQTTLGANLGLGIWWSQHLTTRLGYRYQTYEAQLLNGPEDLDMSSAFISVGYLL